MRSDDAGRGVSEDIDEGDEPRAFFDGELSLARVRRGGTQDARAATSLRPDAGDGPTFGPLWGWAWGL